MGMANVYRRRYRIVLEIETTDSAVARMAEAQLKGVAGALAPPTGVKVTTDTSDSINPRVLMERTSE